MHKLLDVSVNLLEVYSKATNIYDYPEEVGF